MLNKRIIQKTRLRNKFLRIKVITTGKTTSNKKIIVWLYLGKPKNGKLNPAKMKDNSTLTLWKTVEPFLSIKSIVNERITF